MLKWRSMELGTCRDTYRRAAVMLASGFGLGLAPVASGTFGTLPGIILVLALTRLDLAFQIFGAVALVVLAIPVCGAAEKHYRHKDDGRIVADEYMTFPICMLGLPPEAMWLAIAFVVSRAFDIVKLPPARRWQRWRGGLGIVADDVVACLQTLAVMHLLYWAVTR